MQRLWTAENLGQERRVCKEYTAWCYKLRWGLFAAYLDCSSTVVYGTEALGILAAAYGTRLSMWMRNVYALIEQWWRTEIGNLGSRQQHAPLNDSSSASMVPANAGLPPPRWRGLKTLLSRKVAPYRPAESWLPRKRIAATIIIIIIIITIF